MGILRTIIDKIFPANQENSMPSATGAARPEPMTYVSTPSQELDVEKILDDLAAKAPQKLNWKNSIVDLMKLLDIDSSLSARKLLAQELHYSGALDGSTEMNLWLHRQVMDKVAANGGKVPTELKH